MGYSYLNSYPKFNKLYSWQAGLGLILFLLTQVSFAAVRLPKMVGDNMVLQRDIPLKIWGWADAGEKITVTLAGQTATATTNPNGTWKLTLKPLSAAESLELLISGTNQIKLKNVAVGDVWLCSGQSNMEYRMQTSKEKYAAEIAQANYPHIRQMDVANKVSYAPLDDINTTGWKITTPENVLSFSAVGYFFARDIYEKYKVPIGLITSEWGGTIAEAWTSTETLKTFPEYQPKINETLQKGQNPAIVLQNHEVALKTWELNVNKLDAGYQSKTQNWASLTTDISGWQTMALPKIWDANLASYDGIIWFRKEVELSKIDLKKDLKISLGKIQDIDSTYFNGTLIGSTNTPNKLREYTIPAKLLKKGKNILAVRVRDINAAGGIGGLPEEMKVTTANQTISLSGDWQYKIGIEQNKLPPVPANPNGPNQMAVLYNGMIAPIVNYGIKGVLWYQGESNAGNAYQYRSLFPAMIKDWRTQWAQGDFPFLFVQLANYMKVDAQPVESNWAELREAQLMTLSLPNTGMAVIIDVGEAGDIHPKNKLDVGKRLALAARKVGYKENIVHAGPQYKTLKVSGDKVYVTFDYASPGLVAKDSGVLKGFAIAGSDKKFVWADAKIEGDKVVVWSSQIKEPVAVRYGWANNPEGINLYNKAGLPATPFRSDSWPGLTQK